MKFKVNKINLDVNKLMNLYLTAQEKGLTEVGLKLQSDASEEVAVDTGRLRASIAFRVGNNTINKNTFKSDKTQSQDSDLRLVRPDTVVIGSSVEYARRIEKGYSKQSPQGYLRKSVDKNRNWIKSRLTKTFDEIMR